MIRQFRSNTGIDDNLTRSNAPRHHADRRAARQEVQHHLRRNFLWVACYALGYDTVVACRDDDRLASNGWTLGAEDTRELHRYVFQPAQTAWRLRQVALTAESAAHRVGVGRLDRVYGFRECSSHSKYSFSHRHSERTF